MGFLCLEFVNSRWYLVRGQFADISGTKEWLTDLAARWDIGPLPALSDDEVKRLLDTRSCFEELLKRMTGGKTLVDEDIILINSYMSKTSFFRQLYAEEERRELRDVPESGDWNWFAAEAAASISKLYASDKISKLKVCQNPVCGRFFIDESRSESRKWCDNTCASLMKVRRFRQRQKEKQG